MNFLSPYADFGSARYDGVEAYSSRSLNALEFMVLFEVSRRLFPTVHPSFRRLVFAPLVLFLSTCYIGRAQSAPDTSGHSGWSSSVLALPSAPEPQQQQQSAPAQQPAQSQQDQNKPPQTPSLGDLGFSSQQTQANPKLQAMLDKRTRMLKIHQKLALFTLAPMAATLITGPMAKAKGRNGQPITEPTDANLDFHIALGGLTTAMYWTAAYYAIAAPRIPGEHHRGPIRVHEALAWVHGSGMIATPILGYMAWKQENAGEKVHGIASAHAPVADTTVIAYGAALIAVSWPIHFHRHH